MPPALPHSPIVRIWLMKWLLYHTPPWPTTGRTQTPCLCSLAPFALLLELSHKEHAWVPTLTQTLFSTASSPLQLQGRKQRLYAWLCPPSQQMAAEQGDRVRMRGESETFQFTWIKLWGNRSSRRFTEKVELATNVKIILLTHS